MSDHATTRQIADRIGVPLHRICNIIRTRAITESARFGAARLFDEEAVQRIEQAISESSQATLEKRLSEVEEEVQAFKAGVIDSMQKAAQCMVGVEGGLNEELKAAKKTIKNTLLTQNEAIGNLFNRIHEVADRNAAELAAIKNGIADELAAIKKAVMENRERHREAAALSAVQSAELAIHAKILQKAGWEVHPAKKAK